MSKYLGQKIVDVKDTPYRDYEPKDWALEYISKYGGIDGSHHKDWVIDQVARILLGTEVEVSHAKWSCGEEEYRIDLKEPPKEYHDWVIEMKDGEDGPETYNYSEGISP